MSVSGFSRSPLGKDPRRFCEGDPYRARTDAVGGYGRGPVDRRFQTNGNMPPQVAFRDAREWHTSGQTSSDHSYPSSHTGYHHSTGHPSDVPGRHMNEAHPPPGGPDNPYISPGHPNHDQVYHNSYPSPRHSEIGYQSPGRPVNRYSTFGPPSSNPSLNQSSDMPHENGFGEQQLSSHHPPYPPSSLHSTSNGPASSRDYRHPVKPHPQQDHTHRPPPHPIHEGDPSHYWQPPMDSNYRAQNSGYREGPHGFRSDSPSRGQEGYWRGGGGMGSRERAAAAARTQGGGWGEVSDPRAPSQRRLSESNLRKNFVGSAAEERRQNHVSMERCGAPYSPSISSQSSWSPGFDETGSPRIRMPLPSPSTPDEGNPDFHTESHHPYHHHHYHHPHHPNDPLFPGGAPSQSLERERRDLELFKSQDAGRFSQVLSPAPGKGVGGKAGREERRPLYPRAPPYHGRRAPGIVNGMGWGAGNLVRDPRQAGFGRGQRDSKAILLEHCYSKKYQEGSEDYPRYHRISPCSKLSPDLLTVLKSSTAKGKAGRRAPNSSSTTATESRPTAESVSCSLSKNEHKPPANSTDTPSAKKSESKSDKTERQPPSRSPDSIGTNERGMKSPTTGAGTTSRVSTVERKPQPASSMVASDGKTGAKLSTRRLPVTREVDGLQTSRSSSKVRERKSLGAGSEVKSAPHLGRDPVYLPDGFHLDLDLEPTSGSNSNSTCCSESEELADGGREDSDMDTTTEEGELTIVGGAQSSSSSSDDDESLVMSLSGSSPRRSEVEKKSPEKWLLSSPEPTRMRFSRLESSPDTEKLSLKQMTSNRIQLRNGRVLPVNSLAYLTKVTTSPSDTPTSPASSSTPSSSSPQVGPLRRSKRLAGQGEPLPPRLWCPFTDSDSTADQCSTADKSFEMQLSDASSDESEFEMPDFNWKVPESLQCKPPGEGRGRGKRGRGRGRWGRRGGKRGGFRVSTKNSVVGEDIPSPNGVQFYDHKPRTREEDSILQRRLALELEVKRNERIQSEHKLLAHPFHNANMKEEDRVSVVSGSLLTSASSLEGPLHQIHTTSSFSSSKTSSFSTEFSPDLIARVKKISTARSSGDTPLHKCCRTGKFEMVRYLLLVDNFAVNVQDNAGWTPLHEATSNGHTDVAELLLQHGADSNASARDGTRPIHDAIEIGHMEMVKLLIDHNADLAVEYGERTAVEFARDHNQLDIADYIKEVIRTRQEKKKESLAAAAARSPTHHQKTTPTRSSKKEKLLRQIDDQAPRIPVNGYGPVLTHTKSPSSRPCPGSVSFGEELDFPLFYVSPIIELSSKPHLPVYNFQISPPGTHNPRRHNFYMMDDLLDTLVLTEDEFIQDCHEVNILELTVAEFLHRMKVSTYNIQVPVPEKIVNLPRKTAIKFVPLCRMLAKMLDIMTENVDN